MEYLTYQGGVSFFTQNAKLCHLVAMIHLNQAATDDVIVVTLHEKSIASLDRYRFEFTHATTKTVVSKTFLKTEDESNYTTRYNQFVIDTADVFDGKPVGEYLYEVIETNGAGTTTNVVEVGKMYLKPTTEFEYDQYNGTTEYKQYNG
jgi:hypothetical protein